MKILNKVLSYAFMAFIGLLVAQVYAVNPFIPASVFMGLKYVASKAKLLEPALFSALDLDELTLKLGDYHRENRNSLTSELLLSDDFSDKFEVMDDVTDELPLPNLAVTDLLKPADPVNFNPTSNALKFGARTLKVRAVKIDLLFIPQVMEKTWLGKMKNPNDPFDLPFEAFIMNYIMQKARENLLLQGVYSGVYNASGSTPADTMDGFNTIVATDQALGTPKLTPVTTGVITSTNVIDSIEAVYDGFGEAYKGVKTEIKVNPQIFDWYNRRYRALHGANNNYNGMKTGRIPLDGAMCEIVREVGLGASQRTIGTIKENMVYGTASDSFNIDIQKFNRSIKILGDFKAGVEFKEFHSNALVINDQS